MFQELSLFFTLMLFPYLIAVIMPTWRWLLGCTLLFGGLITYGWVDHWIASQKPGYSEGVGGAIGLAIFMALTVGFATGAAIRIVSLVAWWRGHRKGAFWIIAAGPLLPLAVLAAQNAWEQWRKRPAPESCVTAGFRVDVGNARLSVPAAPIFTIYTGLSAARDAFYMRNFASVRTLCSRTSNGAQTLHATNLGMRFDSRMRMAEADCGKSAARWNERLCAAMSSIRRGRIDETGFPLQAYIFSPGQVRLGEFLGSASSYDDSMGARPPRPGEYFAKTDMLSPDGKPLTFACDAQSDSTQWCTASYRWSGGAHLHYSFRAAEGQVERRGSDVDATIRAFIDTLRQPQKR